MLISQGRVENVEELALDFGCKVQTLLSSYLGVPLGTLFVFAVVWNVVEERFYGKLDMW